MVDTRFSPEGKYPASGSGVWDTSPHGEDPADPIARAVSR